MVKKYLKDYSPNFDFKREAFKVARRESSDPYGILSVLPGNALNSISVASMPHELVEAKQSVEQSIKIFRRWERRWPIIIWQSLKLVAFSTGQVKDDVSENLRKKRIFRTDSLAT